MSFEKAQAAKILQAVKNYSEELQSTSSSHEKKEIIKRFSKNKQLTELSKK